MLVLRQIIWERRRKKYHLSSWESAHRYCMWDAKYVWHSARNRILDVALWDAPLLSSHAYDGWLGHVQSIKKEWNMSREWSILCQKSEICRAKKSVLGYLKSSLVIVHYRQRSLRQRCHMVRWIRWMWSWNERKWEETRQIRIIFPLLFIN